MIFSEPLMKQYFTSEVIPISRGRHETRVTNGKETRVIRSIRHVHDWFDMSDALQKDDTPAGREYAIKRARENSSPHWLGINAQSIPDIHKTGLITEAVKAFEKAIGSLETHYTRATPILSPVGGSFSIGRVMMGHPKAAIIRPKAKLPPKQIALTLNCWAGLSAASIAQSMSKIAKAAWQYIAAGGIVELSISFLHNFSDPVIWNEEKHYAFLDTLKINPVNAASYASAASGQFYRALSMPLGLALSGCRGDGLPLGQWTSSATFPISGNALDLEVLKDLRIV